MPGQVAENTTQKEWRRGESNNERRYVSVDRREKPTCNQGSARACGLATSRDILGFGQSLPIAPAGVARARRTFGVAA